MVDDRQIHVRIPGDLLDEMSAAQHALGLRSIAELVRASVEEYLRRRRAEVAAYKRLRKRGATSP